MPKRIKYQRPARDEDDVLRDVTRRDLVRYFYHSIPALLLFTAAAVLCGIYIEHLFHRIAAIIACSIIDYIFLKRLAMGAILMYKAYAPMRVRGLCRYEPSCSTYALISIHRYGIILGCTLGLIRIQHCRPPYGGEDYPSLSSLGRLFKRKK